MSASVLSLAMLLLPMLQNAEAPAASLTATLECPRGFIVIGQPSPVNIKFTNNGKERVKLDPAMIAGLGLRIRGNGPNGEKPAQMIDMASLGKEPAYEVPPGCSITSTVDGGGVGALLAGKSDTVDLWFECGGVNSPPITVDLVEDLTKTLVVFDTSKGVMKFKLDPVHAPLASRNFARLTTMGTFNGTQFHRVLKGFMAQGGDPNTKQADENTWGQGGRPFNGKPLPSEISNVKHMRGTLSMARNGDPAMNVRQATVQTLQFMAQKLFSNPQDASAWLAKLEQDGILKDRKPFLDSGGSQFFLCFGPTQALDGNYTAFGQLVEGDDVLKQIEAVAAASDQDNRGRPKEKIFLKAATLEAQK